jgi:hypothetical protein
LVGHAQLNLKDFFASSGFAALATCSLFDVLAWVLAPATEDPLPGRGLISLGLFDIECDRLA